MKSALFALFLSLCGIGTASAQTSECGVEGLDVDRFEAALRVERASLPDEDFAVVLERCSAEEAYVRVHVGGRVEVRPVSLTDIEPSHRARVLALFAVEVARLLGEWTPPEQIEDTDIPEPPQDHVLTADDLVPADAPPVLLSPPVRHRERPTASATALSRPEKAEPEFEMRFQVGPRGYFARDTAAPNLLIRLRYRDLIFGARGSLVDQDFEEGLVMHSSGTAVFGMRLANETTSDGFRLEADVLAEAGVARVQGMSFFTVSADVSELTLSLSFELRAAYSFGPMMIGLSTELGWQSGLTAVSQGVVVGGMDGPFFGGAVDISFQL